MLATIAFLSTGLLISLFAFAVNRLIKEISVEFFGYSLAYFLLGLAFIGYGVATIIDTQTALEKSMIAGNFLMFTGTAILALRKLKLNKAAFIVSAGAIGLLLTGLRAVFFYPKPALDDGILYFNTQPAVGIFIALLFLFIWLPASLAFSKKIATALKFNELYIIYAGLFSLATMSAIFFLASKSSLSVIITFFVISASFLALLVISLLGAKMKKL